MLRDSTYMLLLFIFYGAYVGTRASPIDGQMREQNTTTNGSGELFQDQFAGIVAGLVIQGVALIALVITSTPALLVLTICLKKRKRANKLKEYTAYLKSLYKVKTTFESENDNWPPPIIMRVFHLAMIMAETVDRGGISDDFVRKTITGKVDDILGKKVPVELKDIFDSIREGERKTVLLEGGPGCGKSTLSLHICSEWTEGVANLFKEYKQVILVRLREQANAKSIADLIPKQSSSIGHDIAEELIACNGKDVLFVLDGWDELPKGSDGRSIISDLLRGTSLPKSSIIITSRPTSSASLYRIVNSRVEILGFTKEELKKYFDSCFDEKVDVKALMQKIKENPVVAGICYLPLNASILVHLYKVAGRDLPKTQFGIFSSLIRNCIYRHLKKTNEAEISCINSLDKLPKRHKRQLKKLCELAYEGVMDDRIIFEDLPSDYNTLGLLQGVESLADGGPARTYNFLHLSIQELLAALYMATQLKPDKQVEKFRKLFGRARFSAVFQFYSAMTKLETPPGIRDVVTEAIEKCLQDPDVCHLTPDNHESDSDTEPQPLLLSLLHCLHEAQDKDLYQRVIKQFKTSELNLNYVSLNQADCLAVGSFLAHTKQFKVSLHECSIGAEGCKMLFKLVSGKTYDLRTLNLIGNSIGVEGAMAVAAAMKTATNLLVLFLGGNSIGVKGAEAVAAAMNTATNLQVFDLANNAIGIKGAEAVAAAMKTTTNLQKLNLRDNNIGDEGAMAVAAAMKAATNLQVLNLSGNSIGKEGAMAVAAAMKTATNLQELYLYDKDIGIDTKHAIRAVAEENGTKIYLGW